MGGLPQGSGTILVADDDAEIRDLIGRILKLSGYTVVEAADVPSALEAVRQDSRIRLVLLDLNMPGSFGSGKTVEDLRALRPRIPVLVVTGLPEQEAWEQLSGQEIAGLLEKPFQPLELIEEIQRLTGA